MAYLVYATKDDVISFTGKTLAELPANVDSILRRASDLITNSILVDINIVRHAEVLKLATCAQVEYWLEGNSNENADQVQAYTAGSISVTYANITIPGPKRPICQRARMYLNKESLLYRGVKTAQIWTERSDEAP